jgi:hypothetical protein
MMLTLRDWAEVQKKLLAESSPENFLLESYARSPLFQELLRSDNDVLWQDMVAASDYPVVAVAGFHCICQNRPDGTVAAGLKIIARSRNPVLIYGPIFVKLSQEKDRFLRHRPPKVDHSALDDVMAQGGASMGSLMIAVGLVPKAMTSAWLRSEKARRAPAVSVAIALDVVLGEEEKGDLTAEEADRLIARLAACPGFPRLVYANLSRDQDPRYLSILRSVIKDTQYDDGLIYLLVIRKSKIISEHLAEIVAGLPEKRLSVVRRGLKTSQRRK